MNLNQQINVDPIIPQVKHMAIELFKQSEAVQANFMQAIQKLLLEINLKHIMHMLSCSRTKAYDIMEQPHRPV